MGFGGVGREDFMTWLSFYVLLRPDFELAFSGFLWFPFTCFYSGFGGVVHMTAYFYPDPSSSLVFLLLNSFSLVYTPRHIILLIKGGHF